MRYFFFFSSRRRHTRYIGDWSSDVCSSDLGGAARVELVSEVLWWGKRGTEVGAIRLTGPARSEERRVGKECRSGGWWVEQKEKWGDFVIKSAGWKGMGGIILCGSD